MPNQQKAKTSITTELATTTNTHKAPQPHTLITTFKSHTMTIKRGIVLVYFG